MRKPTFIARQGRRPSGLLGYIVASIMASETAPENEVTLDLLGLEDGDRVLEIGCGHGATLKKAAGKAKGLQLDGIDFSEVMLRVARRRNRVLMAANRLALIHGDSAHLPYGNDRFDKVFSVHTIYFWARPVLYMREILRVLAPGGRFVLGFRPGEDPAFSAAFPASIYNFRPAAKIEAMLRDSGFCSVCRQSRDLNGKTMAWILACKPAVRSTHNDQGAL